MRYLYGGYSQIALGLDWPRNPDVVDIDMMGTFEDLEVILDAARVRLPFVPVMEIKPNRFFISVFKASRPAWWKNIEFVAYSPRVEAVMAEMDAKKLTAETLVVSRKARALCLDGVNTIKRSCINGLGVTHSKHMEDLEYFQWEGPPEEHKALYDELDAAFLEMLQDHSYIEPHNLKLV